MGSASTKAHAAVGAPVIPLIRVVVAGGGIGALHAAAFQQTDGCEVCAVCTAHESTAGRLSASVGTARAYTDAVEMIAREGPDLVVVAAPDDAHEQIVLAALEAGANVACEKPVGRSLSEAIRMRDAAAETAATHFVPFSWRFVPAVTVAAQAARNGTIGSIREVSIDFRIRGRGLRPWQRDPARTAGGVLTNVACHVIHIIEFLCDARFSEVTARLDRRATTQPAQLEDSVSLLGIVGDDVHASAFVTNVSHVPRCRLRMDVEGSDGHLAVAVDWSQADAQTGAAWISSAATHSALACDVRPVGVPASGLPPVLVHPLGLSFAAMASEVASALRQGRPASPDFDDAVSTWRVIESARASVASGKSTEIARYSP